MQIVSHIHDNKSFGWKILEVIKRGNKKNTATHNSNEEINTLINLIKLQTTEFMKLKTVKTS